MTTHGLIPFRIWIPPNGENRTVELFISNDHMADAEKLLDCGCTFHIEKLRTNQHSITCQRPDDDDRDNDPTIAIEICANLPEAIDAAVHRVIKSASKRINNER